MSSIKQANAEFNIKNYTKAISLYEDLIRVNPEYEKFLAANLLIARKKSLSLIDNIINSESDIAGIKNYLNKKPVKIQKNNTGYKPYMELVEDINKSKVNAKTVIRALRCIEASPFQKRLLQSTFELLKITNLTSLLSPYQLRPSLTIGSLIKIATDQDYWVTYKYIIEAQISKHKLTCKNSKILILSGPSDELNKIKNLSMVDFAKKEISFGTILLNEQKFIGANLCQHYSVCDEWILVEGACKGYPEGKVSKKGMSLDNTRLLINLFPDPDSKITYIQYGWTKASGEDAKSELRNKYITRATGLYLVVIDADEFYDIDDLQIGLQDLKKDPDKYAVVFPQVHFWKNTSIFITGEYYDISHTRIFRNLPGMKYIRNHNFPEIYNEYVHEMGQFKYQRKIIEESRSSDTYKYEGPKCYHLGFAKDFQDMKDKTEYYVNRGEANTRVSTTRSRSAWFNGDLPEKCRVRNWGGNVPKFLIPLETEK